MASPAAKKQANIKPLDDRVVVIRTEAEATSAGGIVLPENAKEKPAQGKVIAVGPGKLLDNGERAKPDVAVGDVVLFGKYSGSEVRVDGDEYVIIKENDILAKFG